MNKNESRYFHTARKMDEALITLLETKDFEYITVKDICGTAGVNRSTFYLHYESVGNLLEETLDYLNEQFHSYFTETAALVIAEIPNMPLDDLIFIRDKYLVPYLTYIRENRPAFSAAVKHSRIMNSDKQYENLFRYIIAPIMARFSVPDEKIGYYNAFFLAGVLAVIQEWLKNGCKEEPEAVSRIMESLVVREK